MTYEFFEKTITPSEFLEYLHNPNVATRDKYSPYYRKLNFFEKILDGTVAVVNAVAYRSVKLPNGSEDERIATQLPSLRIHREWLFNEVLPQARKGERLVFLKRAVLWNLRKGDADGRYVIFTSGHITGLEKKDLRRIEEFAG